MAQNKAGVMHMAYSHVVLDKIEAEDAFAVPIFCTMKIPMPDKAEGIWIHTHAVCVGVVVESGAMVHLQYECYACWEHWQEPSKLIGKPKE
jgi:hypothetical protein